MRDEHVSLKWVDFSSSAASTLQSLMNDPDFTDVTLVSSDHQQVKAHRVVLSSSSPVLREMLVAGQFHPNPLIYLRGVPHLHLKALVDFCYQGEADVARDQLETFLELASELKVKGLCEGEANTTKLETKTTKEELKKPKEKRNTPNIKSELIVSQTELEIVEPTSALEVTIDETEVSQVSDNNTCQECGKIYAGVSVLKRHMKEKHSGVKFSCNMCDWSAERQYLLTTHLKNNHKGLDLNLTV